MKKVFTKIALLLNLECGIIFKNYIKLFNLVL